MSTAIDHRVVEMQFDNAQFERGVSTTMSSLDKLKQSLNMTGASKGLENVSAAARSCDMSGLSGAVETVRAKFSALEVMGVTALANITNSAINTGKRMVSALTVDPIKTGFSEYETKINAIQTIMSNTASKGTTMDDVTRVIGELNTYADKTIYNFAEMTRNIGTFTAAGVGLEESASAIQGIANLAAASGSTSQQASTAMYQLSQALAAGQVKLMDWNSVVNAGMGGEKFQEALKATAREHGVAVDELIKKNGSFRESLQEGWISADILNETLSKFTVEGAKKYADSMMESGKWTQEQADALIKEAQSMEDAAMKVKTFTQLWDTLKESAQSGWSQTWEILVGDFEEAKETLTKISDVIGGIIGESADARNELLQGWKDAGGRADLVDSLFNIINGVISIVKPIKEAFSEIFPPVTVNQLLNFTKGLKDLTEKLTLSESTSDKLKRTFKGLFAVIDIVKQAFGAVFKAISPLFGKVDDLGGGILDVTAKWGDWLVSLNETIAASGFFTKAIDKIRDAFEKVRSFIKPVIDGIKEFTAEVSNNFIKISSDAGERLGPLVTLGNFIKSIFVAMGNVIKSISPYIFAVAQGIGNVLRDLMDTITSSIQNADYDGMFDLANGGIISAIGIFIAKFIKSGGDLLDNAGGFVDSIKGILDGVSDALGAFTESLKADTLKKIAIAIGILSASLLVLSLIDSQKLSNSLMAITTLFIELMTSMSLFTKLTDGSDLKGLGKIAGVIIGLSAAILILSVALKIMSTMSWSEMGVGLMSLVVGLGALVTAVNLLPETTVNSAAKAIKTMSTAILILAVGIKIMSTMSWEEMGIGLLTMAVSLASLVAAVNFLPADTAAKAAGMVGLATAMVILAGALKIMATMPWEEMGVSLVTLAGSLTILVGAMYLMQSAIPGALAMLIIAPALVVLAGALKLMSTMSWEEMGVGLLSLGASLSLLAMGLYLMSGALPGAAALLVAAAALAVLTPALMALGSMSLADVGTSLLMIAGVFTVLGLAAVILAPVVPVIISLCGALALLGVACLAIGAGVTLAATGITALAAALAAGGVGITTFVVSLIGLIPYVIEQIGVGIIALCEVISGGSAAICEALAVIIVALAQAIIIAVPPLVQAIGVLLDELLAFILKYVPKLVDAGLDLIIALLRGIKNKIGDVVREGVNVIMAFVRGIADSVVYVVDEAFNIIISFINGLADAISDNSGELGDAVGNLMTAIVDAVWDYMSEITQAGADIVAGLAQGLWDAAGSLVTTICDVISNAWDSVLEFFGIASPAKEGIKVGMFVDKGIAIGFEKYSKLVGNSAMGVGKNAMSSLQKSLADASDAINTNVDAQPTIRPVLDLTDVTSGANSINNMLSGRKTLSVNPLYAGLASAAMANYSGSSGSDDIISAINKLRKDLANVGGTTYQINGVTYDDGSNISHAVQEIVRAARIERRV